eukprot:m.157278 g.157278  ORF g.157278 m.157278 type:complete len:116 (-) comp15111_c0_seq10:70-417(-)
MPSNTERIMCCIYWWMFPIAHHSCVNVPRKSPRSPRHPQSCGKNWAGVHKLWKPDNRKKLLQRNWNLASGKVGRYDWRFTEEVRRCASPFPDSQRAQQACASLENHSDSLEVAME